MRLHHIGIAAEKMEEKRVKKRQFLYHTCYETENLEEAIQAFEERDARLVSEPKEAVLFGMRRVAFLMTDMGLVELLEQ